MDKRETQALLDLVDSAHTGQVGKIQLAASQMDWRAVQQSRQSEWLSAAERAFAQLDRDGDGVWSCQDILASLRERLAPSEVRL